MLKNFEFKEMVNKLELYSKSAETDIERDVFTSAIAYMKMLVALYGGDEDDRH